MRTWEELEARWRDAPEPSRRSGSVRLLVARRGHGVHEVLSQAALTAQGGLVGDRWADGSKPSPQRQLTLMNATAAALVTDGGPLHGPGDNLIVDFDLSCGGLPLGTQLVVGSALLEVTPAPHTGCKTFAARFGDAALAWINDPAHRERRLRGLHCRVVTDGVVWVGDTIERVGPPGV